MSRLIVSPSARTDLDAIWDYIAIENDHPAAAEKLLGRFQETFSRLSRNTGMGSPCEWLAAGLRRFPLWPYIIFYSPIDDGVEIVRVIHGARNIEAQFGTEGRELDWRIPHPFRGNCNTLKTAALLNARRNDDDAVRPSVDQACVDGLRAERQRHFGR